MLLKKLRKNIDWVLVLLFFAVVYIGGWQAEVFGFIQRGVLATGLLNADVKKEANENKVSLNFYVTDIDGKELLISSLKGKTILINFWATWCPPCVAEMPSLHALYKDLKYQENIVFLMISSDEDKYKAKSFVKRKGFSFPLYFLSSPLPGKLSYESIPTTFVISPQGNIVFQKEGLARYDTEDFREFLQNL